MYERHAIESFRLIPKPTAEGLSNTPIASREGELEIESKFPTKIFCGKSSHHAWDDDEAEELSGSTAAAGRSKHHWWPPVINGVCMGSTVKQHRRKLSEVPGTVGIPERFENPYGFWNRVSGKQVFGQKSPAGETLIERRAGTPPPADPIDILPGWNNNPRFISTMVSRPARRV